MTQKAHFYLYIQQKFVIGTPKYVLKNIYSSTVRKRQKVETTKWPATEKD